MVRKMQKRGAAWVLALTLVLTAMAGIFVPEGGLTLPVSAGIDITADFECANFLAAVRGLRNVPSVGAIYASHVSGIMTLSFNDRGITSLAGIEHFTALTWLVVGGNQLTELDVSNNTALTRLTVQSNQLTEIDVSSNTALTGLFVSGNQLTSLDVSNNTALMWLDVQSNQLTEIDVSNNTALVHLHVSVNQLTEIDVSNNTALTWLPVVDNFMPSRDSVMGRHGGLILGKNFRFYPQRQSTTCEECECPPIVACCDDGIVYRDTETNIRVTGAVTFSFANVPGQGGLPTPDRLTPNADVFIDLTAETLHLADFEIQGFSINGGRTWHAGTITPEQFVRMLNRDLDLWICFRDFNANSRRPQGSGDEHNIIAFPRINRRPAALRAVVNFEQRADATGNTPGRWLLMTRVRSGETPTVMATATEIAVADAANRNRTPDARGFGVFCVDADGAVHGIPVLPLPATGRAVRTSYLIRTAPTANADGTFTAAGRARRINVSSALRAPRLRVNNRGMLRVRAGTSVLMNGAVTSHAARRDVDLSEAVGNVTVWTNAMARRPASAQQTITR